MSSTVAPPDAPSTGLRYQPALDGMRALAIIPVMLFHYPWAFAYGRANPVHGGFLGVDVFFVLSGFLITTLLVDEHLRRGAVSFRSFYARRALRLFPAFAVFFAIAVYFHFALDPGNGAYPTTFGLVGLLFYMANWVQIWQRGSLGPVFGHSWSLAIEEQFYLIFPLIMLGLFRARLRTRGLATVLVLMAVGAAIWRAAVWRAAFHHRTFVDFYAGLTARGNAVVTNRLQAWDHWYFSTGTRADALLVGCAAAVLLVHYRSRISETMGRVFAILAVCAIAAVGVIMWQAVIPDASWLPTWGLFVFEICVALAVVGVMVAPRWGLGPVLAIPPLVWIGRRSYAIYLFHPIVFHLANRSRIHVAPALSLVLQFALVALVAEASWRFIEQPFLRRKRRFDSRAVPSPAAVSAS
jgi:peptidoglycan/LPS O-acetylase OafA/YrhL